MTYQYHMSQELSLFTLDTIRNGIVKNSGVI